MKEDVENLQCSGEKAVQINKISETRDWVLLKTPEQMV